MIPFSKLQNQENELEYIKKALKNGKLEGGGEFSIICDKKLSEIGYKSSLLTTSCTSALEMSSLLLNLSKGDEVIMPSYTFVSTANAFLLRGCVPVFVDICSEDLNIDPSKIESAISKKTKAIVVVHYGGVSCNMKKIVSIAKKFNLRIIEDAAQAIGSFFQDKPLGTLGTFGALSFHNTKNISSGEGGALIINKKSFFKRAKLIHEKGTNRSDFKLGKVSKYIWKDIGSSFILDELSCALLNAQLVNIKKITKARLKIWQAYKDFCMEQDLLDDCFEIQQIPKNTKHNGHLFYLLFRNKKNANKFNLAMRNMDIETTKHYVALHSSSFGKKNSKYVGKMVNTNRASECLIRLPIWEGINVQKILASMKKAFKKI